MAILSTALTNSRAMVPGSTSTNMPDATLLILANQFYRVLALQDTPRVTRIAGGSNGLYIAAVAGTREMTTSVTNIARIIAMRYEETDSTGVDGAAGHLIQYVPKGVYELERSTFPGSDNLTRLAYWERIPSGAWRIFIHPGATGSADSYYSLEYEIEPTDLTSGASTVLLTPINFTRLEHLLAAGQARLLGRDQDFIDSLLRDEATKGVFGKWLANEEGKGMMLSNEGRFA